MTREPTPNERFILIRLQEGKTHAEIAAELRVPESTVSSRCQAMREAGMDASSIYVPPPKKAEPDVELAFVKAWNDEALSNDELARKLGLGWCRLREAATKLRRQGHTLIDRKKAFERAMTTTHRPPDPALPAPGRSIGAAVDILLRQKRDVRCRGELVYLDGQLLTLPALFDLAYGPPTGKWR